MQQKDLGHSPFGRAEHNINKDPTFSYTKGPGRKTQQVCNFEFFFLNTWKTLSARGCTFKTLT